MGVVPVQVLPSDTQLRDDAPTREYPLLQMYVAVSPKVVTFPFAGGEREAQVSAIERKRRRKIC